jgi:hypothetical protein
MNATIPEIPAEIPVELLTVSGIGLAIGLPAPTTHRRLERLGLRPDAFLRRGHEGLAPLFAISRLPEIEGALMKGGAL